MSYEELTNEELTIEGRNAVLFYGCFLFKKPTFTFSSPHSLFSLPTSAVLMRTPRRPLTGFTVRVLPKHILAADVPLHDISISLTAPSLPSSSDGKLTYSIFLCPSGILAAGTAAST